MLNAVFIGLEVDLNRSREDGGCACGGRAWQAVEIAFTVVFTVEVVLRVFAERRMFIRDLWNVFDAFVVGTAWIDLILQGAGWTFLSSSMVFRVLRIFRLARVIRLLRFF